MNASDSFPDDCTLSEDDKEKINNINEIIKTLDCESVSVYFYKKKTTGGGYTMFRHKMSLEYALLFFSTILNDFIRQLEGWKGREKENDN